VKEPAYLAQVEIDQLLLVGLNLETNAAVEIDTLLAIEVAVAMAVADLVDLAMAVPALEVIKRAVLMKKESASQRKKMIALSWTLSLTVGFSHE
jgi:hypothetical protein